MQQQTSNPPSNQSFKQPLAAKQELKIKGSPSCDPEASNSDRLARLPLQHISSGYCFVQVEGTDNPPQQALARGSRPVCGSFCPSLAAQTTTFSKNKRPVWKRCGGSFTMNSGMPLGGDAFGKILQEPYASYPQLYKDLQRRSSETPVLTVEFCGIFHETPMLCQATPGTALTSSPQPGHKMKWITWQIRGSGYIKMPLGSEIWWTWLANDSSPYEKLQPQTTCPQPNPSTIPMGPWCIL